MTPLVNAIRWLKPLFFSGLILLIGLTLSACNMIPGFGNGGEENPAAPAVQMMPDLPGYTQIEGETITDYLGTVAGGAALLAARPELAVTIAAVDEISGCYQEIGAVRARVYSNEAEPLSAGAVAIADKKALTDPVNFFNCVAPQAMSRSMTVQIQPCTANYTLEKDGNTFYIIYAGTTQEICQAFCSNLEGCTAH